MKIEKSSLIAIFERCAFICLCLVALFLPFDKNLTKFFVYMLCLSSLLVFLLRSPFSLFGSPLRWPLLAFFGSFLIALLFSRNFDVSQEYFFTRFIFYGFIFLSIWGTVDTPAKIERIISMMIIAALFVVIDCGYQYIKGVDIIKAYPLASTKETYIINALSGPFGHYNQLGGYIGSLLLGIISLGLVCERKNCRGYALLLSLIFFPVLILTYSRGSWLSLVAGGVVIVSVIYLLKLSGIRKIFSYLGTYIFIIVFLFGIFMFKFPQILGRLQLLVQFDLANRESLWIQVFSIFREHPFVGVGPDCLPLYLTPPGQDAHNILLEVLGEAGLIGLGGFLTFITCYWVGVGVMMKHIDAQKRSLIPQIFFFLAVVVFTFIYNTTAVTLIGGWDLSIFFWINAGLLFKTLCLANEKSGPPPHVLT